MPTENSPEVELHAGYVRQGRWLMDFGGFLLRTGDRLVLTAGVPRRGVRTVTTASPDKPPGGTSS
jgi:hypothetical protein